MLDRMREERGVITTSESDQRITVNFGAFSRSHHRSIPEKVKEIVIGLINAFSSSLLP